MKPQRKTDRKLLDAVAARPCQACGAILSSDPAHVRSRGAGGPDEAWNVMPLCRRHHTEQHKIGWCTFAAKYFGVQVWLGANGWYFEGAKLRREEAA